MLKKLPKILIIIFLSIFILQLASLIFLFTIPEISQAQTEFKPQVPIPGLDYSKVQSSGSTKAIGEYVKGIYKYAIGIVGILAAVVLMFGGVLWLTAGGNNEQITSAKAWIGASLTGLVLALSSYMILATINPALVDFRVTGIDTVKPTTENAISCCQWADSCADNYTKEECESGEFGGKGTWMGLNYTCVNEPYLGCRLVLGDCSNKQDFDLCFVNGIISQRGYCENKICKSCKNWGTCQQGKDYMCCNNKCDLLTGCGLP